jgi:hypothetical protein
MVLNNNHSPTPLHLGQAGYPLYHRGNLTDDVQLTTPAKQYHHLTYIKEVGGWYGRNRIIAGFTSSQIPTIGLA